MTEQEIFEALKDALDNDYLITDFGGTEVSNLQEYLYAIKTERDFEKQVKKEEEKQYNTYKEFIKYLDHRAVGNKDFIIEAVANNNFNLFKGYCKVNTINKNNDIFLEFSIDGKKIIAEWQPSDNYAVWQTCGYCGDDYSGYLLFPTNDKDEYFCLEYSC